MLETVARFLTEGTWGNLGANEKIIAWIICLFWLMAMGGLFCLFRRWLNRFFSSYFGKDYSGKFSVNFYALLLGILIPLTTIINLAWIKHVLEATELQSLGRALICVLLPNLLVLGCLTGIVRSFSRLYNASDRGRMRPIRGVIFMCYLVLFILAAVEIVSIATNQRPIFVLSSLGAAAAVFMFAFQNIMLSLLANVQISSGEWVKIGDWIMMEARSVDGVVIQITSQILKVRNWDMSVVSVPIRLLLEESFTNYNAMYVSKARFIQRALLIDQRSIRFLQPSEVEELQKLHLVSKADMKQLEAEEDPASAVRLPTGDDSGTYRLWSNIELFKLYVENYLHRRSDIRHDMFCFSRAMAPTSQGLPLELYCYSTQTTLPEFEKVRSSIFFHLLAVLPSFRLRVYQDCSDIYQEVGDVPDTIGGAFRYDKLVNPVYPSDKN